MFTGIVESSAKLLHIFTTGSNKTFTFTSAISHELKVDQSLSHNGVCLTVEAINQDQYSVTAIKETLDKTNLGRLQIGDEVNLERCMPAHGRFDGHIVQGHVDTTGSITAINDLNGSYEIRVSYEPHEDFFTVKKGSVCLNGISLTVVDSGKNDFSVHIIPYTWQHTNLRFLNSGDLVNIEFDIIGKYLKKINQQG